MTDAAEPAHAMFKVLAALAELGEATAAAVADKAGLGYSTATAKLRAWEQTGQAERIHTDSKRAVWRLTGTGRATVGTGQAASPTHNTTPAVLGEESQQAAGDAIDVSDITRPPEEPPKPEPEAEPSASASGTTAPQEAPTLHAGEEESRAATDGANQPAAPTPDDIEPDTAAGPDGAASSPAGDRRAKGSLRGAVLDILEAHPERAYKTSELCKLIDAANAGTGAKKASQGAVANAAVKLVAAGTVVQTVEKPATFQLAPTTGSR